MLKYLAITGIAAALAAFLVLPAHAGTTISAIGVNGCGTTPTGTKDGATLTVDQNTGVLCAGSGSSAPDAVTITAPLGATQAPAQAVATVAPDMSNICTGSNTCAVTGTGVLTCVDTDGYPGVSISILTNASGNTITFENTNDTAGCASTNFSTKSGTLSSVAGNGGASTTSAATGPVDIFFSRTSRYWRARVSAGAGSVTVAGNMMSAAAVLAASGTQAVTAGASTAAIGKVGPGYTSAQTPITASATGTTAATTATLAAVSGHTTYLCGFSIRANATAAATGNATVTGTITGTMNFTQFTAALATGIGITEPSIGFPCVPASGTNIPIAVVSAAPGVGGVVSVSAWGYQE